MNLDELTNNQLEAIQAVLSAAPADASLDVPARPSSTALRAAYCLAGETLCCTRDRTRVANGLVRAGLVAA